VRNLSFDSGGDVVHRGGCHILGHRVARIEVGQPDFHRQLLLQLLDGAQIIRYELMEKLLADFLKNFKIDLHHLMGPVTMSGSLQNEFIKEL